MYQVEPIIYRRAQKGEVPFVDTLDGNYLSHLLYQAGKKQGVPKMSIGVLGYKHIEDTRRCVESVLRFVGDIDYELILVDNGSQDDNETLNYYQSVPTMKKKIIQVEEPLGPMYGAILGTRIMYEYAEGDIFLMLGNDNIITENALQNMIACLDSSPDIGMVTPMSSNAYMLQDPKLRYSNFDEMFEAAKEFNRCSDPRKWQERMETATVATAIKREALIQSGFYGFWTAEADLCYRVRRAGYKIFLLGDTWACHNHDYATKKDSQAWLGDTESSKKILERTRQLAEARTGGLTQFEDIMVFEHRLISLLEKPEADTPKILGVNVTAGQPLLDVKNKLREFGIFHSSSAAFSTDAKYYTFLSTAADQVFCDRIQFLYEDLEGQKFDVILLGEAINLFPDPEYVLKTLMGFLEPNGQLLFKLKNSYDVRMFQGILGSPLPAGEEKMVVLTLEDIRRMAEKHGVSHIKAQRTLGRYDARTIETVANILANTKAVKDIQTETQNILTTEYLFCVR